jgi:hypothetical protein
MWVVALIIPLDRFSSLMPGLGLDEAFVATLFFAQARFFYFTGGVARRFVEDDLARSGSVVWSC